MDKFLQKNGSIIASIDTFSVVFENVCLNDVFKALKLEDHQFPTYEEIASVLYVNMAAYGSVVNFSRYKVGFQIKTDDISRYIVGCDTPYDKAFFNTRLPFIRVDAMGQACDNLRSLGVNIEELCFNGFVIPSEGEYHFTRVDFAYDFFDYCPNLFYDIKDACTRHGDFTMNGLQVYCGVGRPISVSARDFDQRTLYFGKTSSDKLLRVYDKKFEQVKRGTYNSDHFKFYDQLHYLPETWYRIELQVRREKYCHMLLQSNDTLKVLRYIYDNYAIRAGKGREVPVIDLWQKIFNWEVIPSIIQNANYVEYIYSSVDTASSYIFGTALSSLMVVLAHYGSSGLLKYINDELDRWQSDPDLLYKFQRFILRVFDSDNKPSSLLKNTEGKYFIV